MRFHLHNMKLVKKDLIWSYYQCQCGKRKVGRTDWRNPMDGPIDKDWKKEKK